MRFEKATEHTTFYFPNDSKRLYKWMKVSPTLARNLVNGRTAALPFGMPIVVAHRIPISSGFWDGESQLSPAEADENAAGRNTESQSSPAEVDENAAGRNTESQSSPSEVDENAAGRNTLRIVNPNQYRADVGLRSGPLTFSLSVAANSSRAVQLPDSTYHVYFQFADRIGQRFQGDDVTRRDNWLKAS